MKKSGRLEYRDLGPGQWVLHTHRGEVALYGDIDRSLDGRQVEVEGAAADAGIGMVGDASMDVSRVRAIS